MGTSLKTMRLASFALIILLFLSAFMMIAPAATIDESTTEPNNGFGTAQALANGDTVTPALVNVTDLDTEDWFSIVLDGTSTATPEELNIIMNVDDWNQHGNVSLYMPADQGVMFEAVKYAVNYNDPVEFKVNATLPSAATYYLVVSGGDFDYNITTVGIAVGANPGYNATNTFAGAVDLPNDNIYHANYGTFVSGQNYVDFWKFTMTASDAAAIDLVEIDPATYYLFDSTYTDITSTYLTGVGTGSIEVDIPAGNAGTYYIVGNCPMSIAFPYEATLSYGVKANIAPPPANVLPTMSNAVITPMTITDLGGTVSISVNALDSDGTVTKVNAASESNKLWTGEINLTHGTGNTWTNSSVVIAAGADIGTWDITFLAYDDADEFNATVMGNITVEAGNVAPTSTYGLDADSYMVYYDEDSMYQLINLSALITDDGLAALTYKIMVDGSAGDGFAGDNVTGAIEGSFWLNLTFDANGFGVEIMTVNVSDAAGYVLFNITVTINGTNDMPVWDKITFELPDTMKDIATIEENVTIEVEEKTMYNMTFTATDIDMDVLTYKTNITGMDNFVFESTTYGGNLSFTPAQADIPAGMEYGLLYALIEVYDASSTTVAAGYINVTFNISNVNDAPGAPTVEYSITDLVPDQEGDNSFDVNITITRPADPDGEMNFTYDIDWGDTKTDKGVKGEDADGKITIMHTYAKAGLYIVNVTVKDMGGLSNWAVTDEINVTEPIFAPPIEWWLAGFDPADKEGDDSVDITFDVLKVTVTNEDLGTGKSKLTTVYEMSGTCSDEVTLVYIYYGSQKNDDAYTVYRFSDPEDFMKGLEIEADSGTWSYTYTAELEYDTPAPVDPPTDPVDPPVVTDVYHVWYSAVGWTEEGLFNHAEKELAAGAGPVVDDDDDDDDDDSSMIIIAAVIGGVALLLIIIVIVVIVVMMGKKKKAAAEQMPPAPEGGAVGPEAAGPQFCACGAEIPAGAPACPVCGAAAPAPAAAPVYCGCGTEIPAGYPTCPACGMAAPAAAPAPEQQYDEFGNPIQAAQPPAPGYEQPPAPGYEQPPAMQQAPPAPAAQPPAPGYQQPPPMQ